MAQYYSGRVEALLALNQETEPLHESLCAQYLLNTRMPKALEAQLRNQILAYGKCFIDSYQHVLTVDADSVEGSKVLTLLPIVLSRMMSYLGEHARWHWVRNFNPEPAFGWVLTNCIGLRSTMAVTPFPCFYLVMAVRRRRCKISF